MEPSWSYKKEAKEQTHSKKEVHHRILENTTKHSITCTQVQICTGTEAAIGGIL